jgi:hypothetical protein
MRIFLAGAGVNFLFSNDTRLAAIAGHVSTPFFRFNSAAQVHESHAEHLVNPIETTH